MCHVGYEWKEGNPYRTCKGGTWTALQMICERKNIQYLNIHIWIHIGTHIKTVTLEG